MELRWVIVNSLQLVQISKVFTVNYMCIEVDGSKLYIVVLYCCDWELIVIERDLKEPLGSIDCETRGDFGGGAVKRESEK